MWGKTEQQGEGEKSPSNLYEINCVAKNNTTQIISKNGDNQSIKTISCKPLCCLKDGEGNIIAQDYIDFTKQKIHRECGYAVLNGEIGGWEFSGATNVQAVYCINLIKDCDLSEDTINVTSNFLNSETYKNRYSKTNIISMKENSIVLTFDLNTFSTIEDFKSFLATNNLIVVYRLANAIEEDLNSTCELIQYENQTEIYNTDNAEMEVEVTNNKAISSTNESIVQLQEENLILRNREEILFEGSSNTNIILNKDISNYKYIEIIYGCDSGHQGGTSKILVNNSTLYADLNLYHATTTTVYFFFATYKISQNNITLDTSSKSGIYNTSGSINITENKIFIKKVVGYRKDERRWKI